MMPLRQASQTAKMKPVSQGAIVLAAGSSCRFGTDKRMAQLANGKTLIQQSINNALQSFTEVLVVLRCDDWLFEQELQAQVKDPRLRTYRAPESALGMGHSLANAIPHLVSDAAFIFLADMPYIQQATLVQLKTAFTENQNKFPIVLPVHAERPGNPVGFDRAYFPDIAQLSGDRGARQIIDQHQDRVIKVAVDDAGVLQDIDSPDDLV